MKTTREVNWVWTMGWVTMPPVVVWIYFAAMRPATTAAPASTVSRAIAASGGNGLYASVSWSKPVPAEPEPPPEQKASPEMLQYCKDHPEVMRIIRTSQLAQEWDLQGRQTGTFVARVLKESNDPALAKRFIALKHYEYFSALNELIHDSERKTVYSSDYCGVDGFTSTWLKAMAGKAGGDNKDWNATGAEGMPPSAAFARFLANPDGYLQELRDTARVTENNATAGIVSDYYHDAAIAHITRAASLHELTMRLQAAGLPPFEPAPIRMGEPMK